MIVSIAQIGANLSPYPSVERRGCQYTCIKAPKYVKDPRILSRDSMLFLHDSAIIAMEKEQMKSPKGFKNRHYDVVLSWRLVINQWINVTVVV